MSTKKNHPTGHPQLFDDLPTAYKPTGREGLRGSAPPVWSRNKSLFICNYISRFQMVTGGGVIIDGFAGPQVIENEEEVWTARRLLELRPARISRFFLCDLSQQKIARLRTLKAKHNMNPRSRRVSVYHGDFNEHVDTILVANRIKRRTPTFALLDMHTFECHWNTVEKLARHKRTPKIEILYFLATGWLYRAAHGSSDKKVTAWWGNEKWKCFLSKTPVELAASVCDRFQNELGYRFAHPYPIFHSDDSRRVLYYLVHATDHALAPRLMNAAYLKVCGDREGSPADSQLEMWAK